MAPHRLDGCGHPAAMPAAGHWLEPNSAAPRVYSDAGNIYIERNGAKTKLTASEMDVDPVLAPDGAYVVYTRQGRGRTVHGYDTSQVCTTEPRPDELRQINADGSGDKLLLKGRKGGPERSSAIFASKQFSSDGTAALFPHPRLGHFGRAARLRYAQWRRAFRPVRQRSFGAEFLPEQIQRRSRRAGAPLFPARRQLRLVLALRCDRQKGAWSAWPVRQSGRDGRQAHGVWCASKP